MTTSMCRIDFACEINDDFQMFRSCAKAFLALKYEFQYQGYMTVDNTVMVGEYTNLLKTLGVYE